ncbi:MAG TPA: hypothetical protein VHD36_08835 [Pirellulales bacterium]|nr:hypothetical protein [Pirellulales bacterium]
MDQPIPNVSRSDVERIARHDFGPAEADRAMAVLDEYQSESSDRSRVQLAVLKLAAGNLQLLRRHMEIAKNDYRDVITAAEYPRFSREIGFSPVPDSLRQDVIDDDWRQYEHWLRR